jgi:hypothetical protein
MDRDVLPPPGWQPKSAFFKAIWKKAEFKIHNPRVTVVCSHCGERVTITLNVMEITPPPD